MPTPAPTPPPTSLTALRVVMEGLEVRAAPDASAAVVGNLAYGEIVGVVEPPMLVADETWWHVNVGSLDGWGREGPPTDAALIDAGSLRSLSEFNVWAGASGEVIEQLRGLPPRVYVPNETGGSVTVIDPASFGVIGSIGVGRLAHHVTPSADLSALYVENMGSDLLTVVDPVSGTATGGIGVERPYNLYFSLDGGRAIVMAEPVNRIDFYDATSWAYLGSVGIPSAGIDHADLSAGGRYLLASTEFGGHVVKVDVVTMQLISLLELGGQPIDVKLSPDGLVFYVANQARGGVSIVDPIAMAELAFLPTGAGAHGLAVSRETRSLYVSNRAAGTISVIDFASRSVAATWIVGGSPDMLQVSTDGTQLWASNRHHNTVSVIDTVSGGVVATVAVGSAPHGLTYFPQPGTTSIGHNGVYR